MINFRPYDPEQDYSILEEWWKGHGAFVMPKAIMPRGYFATAQGLDIAVCFLYLDPGKIGVVEWMTTNPKCAYSRDLVVAVKGLYALLEGIAKDQGCSAVISFVKPNSGEERIMLKTGYRAEPNDPGHRIYAKPLT